LNKGDFTKPTLPIGWLLFTLLAVETYILSSNLPTKMQKTTLPRFKNIIFRHHYVMQKTEVVLKLRKVIFAKFFTSTAKTCW